MQEGIMITGKLILGYKNIGVAETIKVPKGTQFMKVDHEAGRLYHITTLTPKESDSTVNETFLQAANDAEIDISVWRYIGAYKVDFTTTHVFKAVK